MATNPIYRGGAVAAGAYKVVKLVEIVGLDITPCGGTHTNNLAELQVIKIASVRKMKARGTLAIDFLAGDRALRKLGTLAEQEEQSPALSHATSLMQHRSLPHRRSLLRSTDLPCIADL